MCIFIEFRLSENINAVGGLVSVVSIPLQSLNIVFVSLFHIGMTGGKMYIADTVLYCLLLSCLLSPFCYLRFRPYPFYLCHNFYFLFHTFRQPTDIFSKLSKRACIPDIFAFQESACRWNAMEINFVPTTFQRFFFFLLSVTFVKPNKWLIGRNTSRINCPGESFFLCILENVSYS